MQKSDISIIFTVPECKETFEFDSVGEYQRVPCPICGIDFITIQKGGTLLEGLDFSDENTDNKTESRVHGKMK